MKCLSPLLAAVLAVVPVWAQEPSAPTAEDGQGTSAPAVASEAPATQPAQSLIDPDWPANVRPFALDAPTMTDDWFGLGAAMRDAGVSASFFLNNHYFGVLSGGDHTSGGKHSATYDLLVSLDFEKMGLIDGGDMLLHVREQWGRNINPFIGPPTGGRKRTTAQQVLDDADYDQSMYIDQLWYRHRFFDDKLALVLGYLDHQTIVDRNVYANSEDKQFLNEAFDNNPLIPTASATGLGMSLYIKPVEWYTLILSAGDAQRLPLYNPGFGSTFHDEAWFLGYMEHNFHVKIPTEKGPLPGNYRFGAVYDPSPRAVYVQEDEDPRSEGANIGWYLSFDQMLWRENYEDDQGLGGWFRYGWQPERTFRYHQFWSGGFVYTGAIPSRDRDTVGFAVGQLMDSPTYSTRVNEFASSETMYELYYAIQITPWLVVTPDIQYIDNPGGSEADHVSHAVAGGLRFRMTF